MSGTIRVRTVMWGATAVVLALVCGALAMSAWSADAAPGDEDATFVPTAGCRVTDTRPPAQNVGPRSTPLGEDETFTVAIHGANGECTGPLAIPTDAVGVALNVTAVNATTSSNIRLFPADLAEEPLLSNLNVTAGAPPTPNKVDVKLSPDGAIKVYNFKGSVDIVIDIVGYYTNASLKELVAELAMKANAADVYTKNEVDAALNAAAPMWVVKSNNGANADGRTSSPNFSIARIGTGSYAAAFGRVDITNCTWSATVSREPSGSPNAREVRTERTFDNNTLIVSTFNSSGTGVDSGWHLQVFC